MKDFVWLSYMHLHIRVLFLIEQKTYHTILYVIIIILCHDNSNVCT